VYPAFDIAVAAEDGDAVEEFAAAQRLRGKSGVTGSQTGGKKDPNVLN
jgi:hypothetical protein